MKSFDNQKPRVLLLGGDVRSNMGDRAIRQSLIQMIRRLNKETEIHALSRTPELDVREFGIQVVGRHFISLFTGFNQLRKFDVVIWGGGQLLQDDTSLVKNLYWAVILTWMHRVLRVRVIGLGLGIGPLNTRVGRFLARQVFKNLTYFVGRDPLSCEWARSLEIKGLAIEQAPDLALYLDPATAGDAWNYLSKSERLSLTDGEIVVGVAVRRWFHLKQRQIMPYEWMAALRGKPGPENARFEIFLNNLTEALTQFGQNRKVRLLFFPMASQDWEGDASISQRVANGAGLPSQVLKLACDASTVKAITGLCDMFVSVRMHSAILAMSMQIPCAGIVHVTKTSHFYHLLGQDDYLLSIDDASEQGGASAILNLLEKTFLSRNAAAQVLHTRLENLSNQQSIYEKILTSYIGRQIDVSLS